MMIEETPREQMQARVAAAWITIAVVGLAVAGAGLSALAIWIMSRW